MSIEVRTVVRGELPEFRDALMTVFGSDPGDDPQGDARIGALLDPARIWAAFDGGRIVATAGAYDLHLAVPGGSIAATGLTMVTVRPTHRRRGLLRALIARHLEEARGRGIAISALWATESSIYERFGYGIAAECDELAIKAAHSLPFRELGERDALVDVGEAEARERLPAIYARATAARPGAVMRSDLWWRERRFLEVPFVRKGASARRHVIAERGTEATGYLVYRQRPAVEDGLFAGKVEIVELLATDPRAEASLWRFACAVDLFPNVSWWNAPVDCALPWLVRDPRRISRHRADTLWLRIGDVPAALEKRRYPSDGVLRLAIDGEDCVELTVEAGVGRCARSARAGAAELSCDRAALGAIYLGHTPASRLARAGLMRGSPAALEMADRIFTWPVAAWCPEMF